MIRHMVLFFLLVSFVLPIHANSVFAQENESADTGLLALMPEPTPSAPAHDFGDNNPSVYVCIGDSITYGKYIDSRANTYPAVLQQLLGQTVINEGEIGAQSKAGITKTHRVLRKYKPGHLLILYGANDFGKISTAECVENLRTMVLAAKGNKTAPVVATLTPAFFKESFRKGWITKANGLIRTMVEEENVLLADLEKAFDWNSEYMLPDGLHPNSQGHALIAQTFYDALNTSTPNEESNGGGGGGCSVDPNASFGMEWLLLALFLAALRSIYRRN